MQKSWQSDLKIFTPDECAMLVKQFDESENHNDENNQPFYKNSYGVFNLPASMKFVDRITENLREKYPNIVFENTYIRSYTRHSYLKIHTDRVGLDLTLSICIEDKNNLDWPLCISAKKYDGEWDMDTDPKSYEESYLETHMGVGYGAFMHGRTFPHWREELLCGEKQRAVYVFYHWKINKPFDVLLTLDTPNLALYGNFISEDKCTDLISYAKSRMQRAEVLDKTNNSSTISSDRTSSVAYFQRGETPLIASIEKMIAIMTNTTIEQGEGLQVLRYEIGQEFKPHYDHFPDDAHEHLKFGGQRIATAIIYLSAPSAGGETTFPQIGLEIKSVQGNLLIFKYDDLSKEIKTLHSGKPVIKGEKWIATKWIRQEGA